MGCHRQGGITDRILNIEAGFPFLEEAGKPGIDEIRRTGPTCAEAL
jgi:hypothetical protein